MGMVFLGAEKGQKRRLRKALRASEKAFTRCNRCPLPSWRARGLCSACATLKRDEEGRWYISPDPIVTWDESVYKKRRRPAGLKF